MSVEFHGGSETSNVGKFDHPCFCRYYQIKEIDFSLLVMLD